MGEANMTIMLMYEYVYVCLFLSTNKIGYGIIGHATKRFNHKEWFGIKLLIIELEIATGSCVEKWISPCY